MCELVSTQVQVVINYIKHEKVRDSGRLKFNACHKMSVTLIEDLGGMEYGALNLEIYALEME